MYYDSVLTFVRGFLENMHKVLQDLIHSCKENVIYYLTDNYYCNYVCMKLPNPEETQYFIIGPFTYVKITQKNYLELLNKLDVPNDMLPLLETYYYNIAYISSEAQFKNLINTLCEAIWREQSFTVSVVHGNLWNEPYTKNFSNVTEQDSLHASTNMLVTETRYKWENKLMQIVSQGNLSQIDQVISQGYGMRYIPRLTDSLRDYKNYMIILNTILRKAAEMGTVHPVYLDQLSTKFAQKIETLTSCSDADFEREMIYKYCLLVRNHSVKGYSHIIQKVINQIDLNLTGDLRLKSLSEMFNISAGYLSTLFKKETGMTLTDYVNKKRIEYAILLLNTTHLQIQVIASYCGIMDINYFTRIFKKFTGMTPKKYKELISE